MFSLSEHFLWGARKKWKMTESGNKENLECKGLRNQRKDRRKLGRAQQRGCLMQHHMWEEEPLKPPELFIFMGEMKVWA